MLQVADLVDLEDFTKIPTGTFLRPWWNFMPKMNQLIFLPLKSPPGKRKLESSGGTYLVALSNTVPTASHVEEYARIVQRKSTLRKLLGAASNIPKRASKEGVHDVEEILDEASKQLYSVTQKHLKESFSHSHDSV